MGFTLQKIRTEVNAPDADLRGEREEGREVLSWEDEKEGKGDRI